MESNIFDLIYLGEIFHTFPTYQCLQKGVSYYSYFDKIFFFYSNIYKWQKITSKKANLRKQNNTISKT